jgi:uncharacterized protein YfaT (DUF1175 family)
VDYIAGGFYRPWKPNAMAHPNAWKIASGGFLLALCLAGVGMHTGGTLRSLATLSAYRARNHRGGSATNDPAMLAGDRFLDGTPDFLRLDAPSDQRSFRFWFTLIAEYQALRPSRDIPREIGDCAALLRYSYRNALREHDAAWARETGLTMPSALPPIEKYRYPFTPLGAALFRVRAGAFELDDLANGSFAEFADAEKLKELNTHFVSRDVRRARPGDILFYRQLEQDSLFHSMIFIGHSQWFADSGERGVDDVVVYDTGGVGKSSAEMRRIRMVQLLQFPSPRWRPVPGNSNFLGVYRWNILRGEN